MGIRFQCHTCGRRLNVKESQAGKNCLCPRCRSRITIPFESIQVGADTANDSELEAQELQSHASSEFEKLHASFLNEGAKEKVVAAEQIQSIQTPNESVGTSVQPAGATTKSKKGNVEDKPGQSKPISKAEQSPDNFLLGQPGSKIPANYIDPVYEAPHRVWHVRDLKGKETGPIKGKKLRRQIDSGMIKPDFKVLREDWEDWQQAATVFPELGPGKGVIPSASESVYTDPNYRIPDTLTPKARKEKLKRRNTILGISALIAGLLITVVLCYLLIKLI